MTTAAAVLEPRDLLSALRRRYAVKRFDPAGKLSPEVWDALEEALVLSPSSYGFQPWKFFVVEDRALRAKLREVSYGQPQITDADKLVVFTSRLDLAEADAERLVAQTAKTRGVTPESLAGFRKALLGAVTGRGAEQKAAFAACQAHIALGVLLASAAALGVDACPMGGIDAAAYDRILGLREQGYTALCVAAVGVRAADDAYAAQAKVRFPRAEVVARL